MSTRLAFRVNPLRHLLPSLVLASALVASAAIGAPPAHAQLEYDPAEGTDSAGPQTEAELVADTTTIRPGQPFNVALHLKLEKGWHVYWRNPGDSGTPTRIKWSLPAGFKAGALQWPTPHRFVLDSMVAYGYENEVWLLTQITPPANLPLGKAATLAANADWLVCSEQCVPQKKTLGLTLNVAAPDTRTTELAAPPQFTAIRSSLPLPASATGYQVRADQPAASVAKPEKAAVNLRFVPPAGSPLSAEQVKQLYFYPADESTMSHPKTQKVVKEGTGYRLPLVASEYAGAPLKRLRGVLIAPGAPTTNDLSRGIWIDVPVTTTPAAKKK